MSQLKIGLIVGAEYDWPEAFMTAVNTTNPNVTAELVKLGGILMEEPVEYAVIIDRMSHKVPYYSAYAKHAALQGAYIIDNPFTWDADNKFVGTAVLARLGLQSPRTVVLPNKYVDYETTPDTFRNLKYPMDWEAIIAYVGVPAIFKDIHSGGRQFASRVHNVDELIQHYDESGTRTTILQQLIETDNQLHAFVIGQQEVMVLHYSHANGAYLPGILSKEDGWGKELAETARRITQVYGYDVNMVEFVVKNDTVYVINTTNPAPDIDRNLLTAEQFDWCVRKMAAMAVERALRPLSQPIPFNLDL
jgi:glutathione synthase/RimK-type ligase-like ATP-grasp enzyme